MGMKSFFNKLAEKRDAKCKYKVLAAAIRADDLAGVKAALDAGADAGYYPGTGGKKNMPLHLALRQGNTEIFEALLNTDQGKMAAFFWHYDFRRLNKTNDIHQQIYFLPSLLYAAIDEKREGMALLLVKLPLMDLECSGELIKAGGSLLHNAPEYKQLIKPADFAREQGLTRVADAIADKLKPVLVERAQAEADKLTSLAEQKRAEAEKLLREAEALQPTKPAAPKPGFKL